LRDPSLIKRETKVEGPNRRRILGLGARLFFFGASSGRRPALQSCCSHYYWGMAPPPSFECQADLMFNDAMALDLAYSIVLCKLRNIMVKRVSFGQGRRSGGRMGRWPMFATLTFNGGTLPTSLRGFEVAGDIDVPEPVVYNVVWNQTIQCLSRTGSHAVFPGPADLRLPAG